MADDRPNRDPTEAADRPWSADRLYAEAARKLDAYLATGLAGFRQQAVDRLRAAGVDVPDGLAADHLRAHLRLMGL